MDDIVRVYMVDVRVGIGIGFQVRNSNKEVDKGNVDVSMAVKD